jgi:hypothetical protein
LPPAAAVPLFAAATPLTKVSMFQRSEVRKYSR